MRDILNVEATERVDLRDFEYAIDEQRQEVHRELHRELILDPDDASPYRVLSGFVMDNPAGKQLRVTLGRGIAGQREGTTVKAAALITSGDATRTVDLTTFSPGTYGVYIRFELIDGTDASRAFWDPSGGGGEFAQTIPTRRLANWGLRVEASSPGGEWLKLGEVDQATMAITDQRDFFFEGSVDSSYAAGWSAEGGGVANDRNADRATYGVTNLQKFSAAMRQCLRDIRGRGLREWYEKGIGGLNVGFDTDPTEDEVNVGDANFGLKHPTPSASSVPALHFAANSGFYYDRTSDIIQGKITNTTRQQLTSAGLQVLNGLYVGALGVAPTDNDIYAVGDVAAGVDLVAGSRAVITPLGSAPAASAGAVYMDSNGPRMLVGDGSAYHAVPQLKHTLVADLNRSSAGLWGGNGTYTIAANALRVGSLIRVVASGDISYTSGSGQVTVRVRFGSTTGAVSIISDITGVQADWFLSAICVVRSLASPSGNIQISGHGSWTGGGATLAGFAYARDVGWTADTINGFDVAMDLAAFGITGTAYLRQFAVEVI